MQVGQDVAVGLDDLVQLVEIGVLEVAVDGEAVVHLVFGVQHRVLHLRPEAEHRH